MSSSHPPDQDPAEPPPGRPRDANGLGFWRGLLLILAAFVLASALAGALGATNLGTALAFGQIAVALTVVYLMLRR
jgi:hypothetical protein